MSNSPVRKKQVVCPACNKKVEITCLPPMTSRLYISKERDEDQHVTRWEWHNPLWQHINPYYYSIWFCPLCYYADFEEDFVKDRTNPSNKILVVKALMNDEKNKPDSTVVFLGKQIDYERMDLKSAVVSFLLAIYIQELIKEVEQDGEYKSSRDWKKLARLYLRLSWLFREKEQSTQGETESFLSAIFKEINDFRKNTAVVKGSFLKVTDAIERFKKDEETKGRTNPELNSAGAQLLGIVDQAFVNIEKSIAGIQIMLKKGEENVEGGGTDTELKQCKDFLLTVTARWPDVPTSEREAVDKAIMYFITAANNDSYLSAMASFKMSEFASLLYRITGRPRESIECLKEITKKASDHRANLFRKRNKASSAVDKINVEEEINQLNAYIQEVSYKAKSGEK